MLAELGASWVFTKLVTGRCSGTVATPDPGHSPVSDTKVPRRGII